jgi:hypothetical protein
MTVSSECTEACTATPDCAVCWRRKKLRGRDYAAALAGMHCDPECPGYDKEPRAGHLWWSEWREHEANRERSDSSEGGER